jgi:hypothetical protein
MKVHWSSTYNTTTTTTVHQTQYATRGVSRLFGSCWYYLILDSFQWLGKMYVLIHLWFIHKYSTYWDSRREEKDDEKIVGSCLQSHMWTLAHLSLVREVSSSQKQNHQPNTHSLLEFRSSNTISESNNKFSDLLYVDDIFVLLLARVLKLKEVCVIYYLMADQWLT